MDENTQVEPEVAVPTAAPEVTETSAPSQESQENLVQAELDKVETAKRTKKEKLEFTKQRIERQLAELGESPDVIDEDRPLTLRTLQAYEAEKAKETAVTLAEQIDNEAERRLVLHHLENTIKPSGDAETDLRNARLIVNAVKNGQLAEESARVSKARIAPSAPSAPPRQEGAKPEFSAEEAAIMRGFKLTEEEAAQALGQ